MEFKRLEIFCKVFELNSFTKASLAQSLSQSAVSDHIRTLEKQIGEALFERWGRGIVPTPAGKLYYQYVRQILTIKREAMTAIRKQSKQIEGRLIIGASSMPGNSILPKMIGKFLELYPLIQISIKIENSQNICKKVISGELEMGIIGARWTEPKIFWRKFAMDELILTVSSQNPLVKKGVIRLDQLKEQKFIIRERESGTRKVTKEIFEKNNFSIDQLDIISEMNSSEAIRQALKSNFGVSIISKYAVQDELRSGVLEEIQIDNIRLHRPIYLIRNKVESLSYLTATFFDYCLAWKQK